MEIALWPKEVAALQHSGRVLRETIDQVLAKNPAAAGKAPASPKDQPAPNGKPSVPVRVTMGTGANGGGGRARVTISGQGRGGR